MMHDVFLSYRRSDQTLAEALVRALEARGLTVWWDQKIDGGTDWRDAIAENLEQAETLVILFSEDCNNSRQLRKELAMADLMEKDVVPVLIEDTRPRGHFLYELASRNWIRVFPNPMSKLEELADRITEQEFGPKEAAARRARTPNVVQSPSAPDPVPDISASETSRKPASKEKRDYRDFMPFKWYELLIFVVLFGIALLGNAMNDEASAFEELTSQEFWDTLIGVFAIAWIYGAIIFPIRYFLRGRRLRRAILYFTLSTSVLAILTAAVSLGDPSFTEYWAEGEEGDPFLGLVFGMIGVWIITAFIAFAIYGALIGSRVLRQFNRNVETI
ncbi:MAG: TIR domain-containing protein [Pseudomonadota bacterium]